ncbi:MAG: hypothetical protein KDE27_29870 [Planctomycetes bacterium]|nr:hypothetical protein [Planctomycetota bacterium]
MQTALKLPKPSGIGAVMSQLVDGAPAFARGGDDFDYCSDAKSYTAVLLDDQNQPIGALIADLVAAVYLGGNFMMAPEDALAEQVKSKQAGDATIMAFSEIANIITTSFNALDGNPHVRSCPATDTAKVLATELGSWMKAPGKRTDVVADFPWGKGRLILVSR